MTGFGNVKDLEGDATVGRVFTGDEAVGRGFTGGETAGANPLRLFGLRGVTTGEEGGGDSGDGVSSSYG